MTVDVEGVELTAHANDAEPHQSAGAGDDGWRVAQILAAIDAGGSVIQRVEQLHDLRLRRGRTVAQEADLNPLQRWIDVKLSIVGDRKNVGGCRVGCSRCVCGWLQVGDLMR